MGMGCTNVALWIILDHLGIGSVKVICFSLLVSSLITFLCYSRNKFASAFGINSAILVIFIGIVDIFTAIILQVSPNKNSKLPDRKQAHDLPNIPFHLKKRFKHALLAVQEPKFEMEYEGPGQVSSYQKNDSFYESRKQNVVIDRFGFRKHQTIYSSKKPEIIVLGDSYVFGYGNNSSETIPALLENKLKKPTYNMGVYGASVPNGIELLNVGGILGLPPLEKVNQIVLIVFGGNDFIGKSPYYSKVEALKRIRLWLRRYSPIYKLTSIQKSNYSSKSPYVLCNLNDNWDIGGKIAFNTGYIESATSDTLYKTKDIYKASDISKSLKVLRNTASNLQANVLVLYLPSKVEIYANHTSCNFNFKSNPNIKRLKRDSLDNKFGFIDITELFKNKAAQKNLIWWRDDTHLNEKGAQIVADEIANYFRTLEN